MSNPTVFEIRYTSELSGQKALYDSFHNMSDAFEEKREFYARCLRNGCDRTAASIEVNEVKVRY